MESGCHLLGDRGLLVDCEGNAQALALKAALEAGPPPGLLECVPGLAGLLLHFDPLAANPFDLSRIACEKLALLKEGGVAGDGRNQDQVLRLPVCYDESLAPDLAPLAQSLGLAPAEAAAIHAGADYRVMFLGFLPGFGYLSGLPEILNRPRLTRPRTRVPAGSVALADGMSAVYPLESPGGWHLIGQTPVKLFDPFSSNPFLLKPGLLIRFDPISLAEYRTLQRDAP